MAAQYYYVLKFVVLKGEYVIPEQNSFPLGKLITPIG